MRLLQSSATSRKICPSLSATCRQACCSTFSLKRLGQPFTTTQSQTHRRECSNACRISTESFTPMSFSTGRESRRNERIAASTQLRSLRAITFRPFYVGHGSILWILRFAQNDSSNFQPHSLCCGYREMLQLYALLLHQIPRLRDKFFQRHGAFIAFAAGANADGVG